MYYLRFSPYLLLSSIILWIGSVLGLSAFSAMAPHLTLWPYLAMLLTSCVLLGCSVSLRYEKNRDDDGDIFDDTDLPDLPNGTLDWELFERYRQVWANEYLVKQMNTKVE